MTLATHTVLSEPGISLAATSYAPDGPPQVAVILSSGTGFARSFYRRLAGYLCDQGAYVVTYDFRGIAESSSPELLRTADLPDWGKDLDAVIRWVRDTHPGLPVVHLGHSAGGHIVAFSKEARHVQKHLFVAVGSGTLWHHFVSRWPLETYFWWGLGTVNLALWGHLRRGGGWTGAALPGPVFRTWRRWSHQGRYYATEVAAWNDHHPSREPLPAIESYVFTDDGISTPRAARTILDCFPEWPTQLHLVSPRDLDVAKIGHEGAFRTATPLWERWWASIQEATPLGAPVDSSSKACFRRRWPARRRPGHRIPR